MLFLYPLTNNVDGPYIESDVNSQNVHLKIIHLNESIYDEKYALGFWNDKSKITQIIKCVNKLKLTNNTQESELLVYGAIHEYSKLYELRQIPPGFEINDGLYSTTEDKEGNTIPKLISHMPVWVPFQYHNCDSNTMMIDLAFYAQDSKLTIVPLHQQDAFQRRGIMQIAAHGALLEESKTNAMISWLTNYIHHNDIPLLSVFERFGWKDDLRFVVGDQIYSDHKQEDVKIINVPDKSIQGMVSSGTISKWIEHTKKILRHDKARLKCYAACAAPLLKLLNQKSFIYHDYGESSTGKTKTSELAMSIWGDPEKLLMSSFGTMVGKERLATIFTDLPIFVDETQVSTEEDNKTFIYLIANETGKLRGQKEGGLQDTASWKTIAFTTGEAPLTSDKSFMGMSMRVIEQYGGLGAHDKEAIDEFKTGVKGCYGVLGPLIIQEIIDNYTELPKHLSLLTHKFNQLTTNLPNLNGVGGRSASMFAVLVLGGMIFEEVISQNGGESKDPGSICSKLYSEYLRTMAQSGYSSKAYDHLMSWANTKEKYFLHDMMALGDHTPYDTHGNITDDFIDIFPHTLKEVMERGDFNYRRILKDWSESGHLLKYIDANGKPHNNHIVRFFGKVKKTIRIKLNMDTLQGTSGTPGYIK